MTVNPHQPAVYRIKVAEPLDDGSAVWLDGMAAVVEISANGAMTTVLTGQVADQAALRGLLTKIWNMNLTVISVYRMKQTEKMLHSTRTETS